MKYLSTSQASAKWGITTNRITILAKTGRIAGAFQIGSRWMIPENAEKPLDGRTKTAKNAKDDQDDFFRYPGFEGREINDFNPPLTPEEIRLKNSSEAFHACRFEESKKILGNLADQTHNRYHRIWALYASCMTAVYQSDGQSFFTGYGKLSEAFLEDFLHKREMMTLLHEIDAALGASSYFSETFRIDPNYPYHETYLPHLTSLCTLSLYFSDLNRLKPRDLNLYELNCIEMESKHNYLDLQTIHLYLGMICNTIGKKEEMTRHLVRTFELAEEYELYFQPALLYYYMGGVFEPILSKFSKTFYQRMRFLKEDLHKRFCKFMSAVSVNNIFNLLMRNDYLYVYLAVQGCSNKEAAHILHLSEKTVSKRYSGIYGSLGIKNKKELVDFYRKNISHSFISKQKPTEHAGQPAITVLS